MAGGLLDEEEDTTIWDAERLAECVGRLVDSPSEREALSESALAAARRYDWDLLKVGYVETCREVVASSRGRS